MSSAAILLLMTMLFLAFGYLGVPVAFSLMAGVMIGVAFTDVTPAALIQKMFDGVDSEPLLAVPFFLLVGELMTSANVVIRIANLSQALVGHIRGGLGQVVAVFSMFFSGIVPGLMIGFGLMIYCYLFGLVGFRRPRASFPQLAETARAAALPMMIPVILLGGILTGWFTPTEAGAVAVVWILLVIIPLLNRKHIRALPYDFCEAGLIYSLPLVTIAAASAFGWMVAYLRGPIVVSGWITAVAGDDPRLIMFLLVLVFTIVGDFIEPIPAIIIFMPVVTSLTTAADINAVHMGVVLIATLAFGLITPPYGLALLMAAKFVG